MKDIRLSDFHFELPAERIPSYPLAKRDHAKLLYYSRGQTAHHHFYELPGLLPANAFLVYNNTRVIPARLIMERETGAKIEILLLEPEGKKEVQLAMAEKNHSTWHCMVGNLKKWKENEVLKMWLDGIELGARLIKRDDPVVELSWNGELGFAELIEKAGKLPLPPYIKRATEESDKSQYQTMYAEKQGAVAAPTAGLHFTAEVMENLEKRDIASGYVTLHVGAGTFQPVKVENPATHPMHNEQMIIERSFIEKLLAHHTFVIPVGTTSMRTLESLYWYGCKLHKEGDTAFFIEKLEAYNLDAISVESSLKRVLEYMDKNGLEQLPGQTEILIMPGYRFRLCRGLITNFHLPATTLILLVAAFIGKDWRKVYSEALENDYRFLSFGDSSLLIP